DVPAAVNRIIDVEPGVWIGQVTHIRHSAPIGGLPTRLVRWLRIVAAYAAPAAGPGGLSAAVAVGVQIEGGAADSDHIRRHRGPLHAGAVVTGGSREGHVGPVEMVVIIGHAGKLRRA